MKRNRKLMFLVMTVPEKVCIEGIQIMGENEKILLGYIKVSLRQHGGL